MIPGACDKSPVPYANGWSFWILPDYLEAVEESLQTDGESEKVAYTLRSFNIAIWRKYMENHGIYFREKSSASVPFFCAIKSMYVTIYRRVDQGFGVEIQPLTFAKWDVVMMGVMVLMMMMMMVYDRYAIGIALGIYYCYCVDELF